MTTIKDLTEELDELFNQKSTTPTQIYLRHNRLVIDYNKNKLTFTLIPEIELVSFKYSFFQRRLHLLVFKYKSLIKQVLFDQINAKQKELQYYVQTQQDLIYSF